MSRTSQFWTPAMTTRAIQAREAGFTFSQIAADMRLSHRRKISASLVAYHVSTAGAKIARPTRQPKEPVKTDASAGVPFLDLRFDQCRFIFNEPSVDGFGIACGAPVHVKSSYCPEHYALCVRRTVKLENS